MCYTGLLRAQEVVELRYPQIQFELGSDKELPAALRTTVTEAIGEASGAELVQLYPEALTPAMRGWYELRCEGCDVKQVTKLLQDTDKLVKVVTHTPLFKALEVATGCATSFAEMSTCEDDYNDLVLVDPVAAAASSPLINNGKGLTDVAWQIESINAPCAWDLTAPTQDRYPIAIIDTEVDLDHEDLAPVVSRVWESSNWTALNHHGTVVSGGAVALQNNGKGIAGACDVCEVEMYAVEHTSGGGGFGNILKNGIVEALTDGQKVISFSWSGFGYFDSDMHEVFAEVEAQGAILVMASAYSSHKKSLSAAYPSVLYAGSAEGVPGTGGKNVATPASGLVTSPYLDFIAPGEDVFRTENPDFHNYLYNSGGSNTSSVATPIVAALAAMIWHEYPCLTREQVLETMRRTATTNMPGYDPNEHGAGLVNFAGALEYLAGTRHMSEVTFLSAHSYTDEVHYFERDLVLRNGARLTVDGGSRLVFAPGYGIRLYDDAQLNVIDATLTGASTCRGGDGTWAGIQIDSYAFRQGWTAHAPKARLLRATVEGARTGVRDYGANAFAHYGGEIDIDRSTFLNCRTGVESFQMQHDQKIWRTTFLADDDYAFPSSDLWHGVFLGSSPVDRRADLRNCTFEDARTSVDPAAGGIGVFANEAGFTLNTRGSRNVFRGLKYGVHAQQSGYSTYLTTVTRSDMFDCHLGVWFVGYNLPIVAGNNIHVTDENEYLDRFGNMLPTQGIRIEQCNHYDVNGNDIEVDGYHTMAASYGMTFVDNGGTLSRNAVRRNTVTGAQYGAYHQGDNGAGSGGNSISGLCYDCNTFASAYVDVESGVDGRIASAQAGLDGSIFTGAGNQFSSNTMQFRGNGANVTDIVDYYWATYRPNPVGSTVNGIQQSTDNTCHQPPPCDPCEPDGPMEPQMAFSEASTSGTGANEYYAQPTSYSTAEGGARVTKHDANMAALYRALAHAPGDHGLREVIGRVVPPVEVAALDRVFLATLMAAEPTSWARATERTLPNVLDGSLPSFTQALAVVPELLPRRRERLAASELSTDERSQTPGQARLRAALYARGEAPYEPLLKAPTRTEQLRLPEAGTPSAVPQMQAYRVFNVLGREVAEITATSSGLRAALAQHFAADARAVYVVFPRDAAADAEAVRIIAGH